MHRVDTYGDVVRLTIDGVDHAMSPGTAERLGLRLAAVGARALWEQLTEAHPDGWEITVRDRRLWAWFRLDGQLMCGEHRASFRLWEALPPEVGERRVRVRGGTKAHVWRPGVGLLCGEHLWSDRTLVTGDRPTCARCRARLEREA